jgi:hypothetical protein
MRDSFSPRRDRSDTWYFFMEWAAVYLLRVEAGSAFVERASGDGLDPESDGGIHKAGHWVGNRWKSFS